MFDWLCSGLGVERRRRALEELDGADGWVDVRREVGEGNWTGWRRAMRRLNAGGRQGNGLAGEGPSGTFGGAGGGRYGRLVEGVRTVAAAGFRARATALFATGGLERKQGESVGGEEGERQAQRGQPAQ